MNMIMFLMRTCNGALTGLFLFRKNYNSYYRKAVRTNSSPVVKRDLRLRDIKWISLRGVVRRDPRITRLSYIFSHRKEHAYEKFYYERINGRRRSVSD